MVPIPDTNHLIWCPPTVGNRLNNPCVETTEQAMKHLPVLKFFDKPGGVCYAFDLDWAEHLVRRGDQLFQKKTT